MKRLVAIFLLFILFIAVAGYHAVYYFYLQQVKTEMKQYLLAARDKEVITFKIPDDSTSQLIWENDHEFSLNGNMYDVIQKKREGKYLMLQCISDEKETALINQYQQINREHQPSSDPKWVSLYKWMDIYLIPSCLQDTLLLLPTKRVFQPLLLHLYACFFPVITPPPRLNLFLYSF